MKDFTTETKRRRVLQTGAAVLFWLVVWHIASVKIGKPVLLVSPVEVVRRLFELMGEAAFWRTVGFSFVRIAGGFLSALVVGIFLAGLSAAVPFIRILLSPVTAVVKATPVASFIILALLWVPAKNLALFISFLMVFPVIYTNTLTGILSVDKRLLEMARVFRVPPVKRFLYVYLPDVMPFFVSACRVSLGLCWKSGVAAEVIGQPNGSIGDRLYRSKIYLETADLFAWTVVIIVISAAFEKLFLLLLGLLERRIAKGGVKTGRA